jgi:tellurite resistance protein
MIDRLNRDERMAMMELLAYLAKTDGKITEVNQEVLREYAELLEVDPPEIDSDITPEELVPQFQSPASRVVVLQEVFRLANLDGVFTIGEESAIIDIASLMGFPMEFVQRVEQWVLDGLDWTLTGEKLIEEGSHLALRKT